MIEIFTDRYSNYIDAVASVLDIWDTDAEITFDFNKKLDSDAGGYCMGDVDPINGYAAIEIEIATHVQGEALDKDTILQNIAHEMIHAKQIITGRLEDLGIQLATAGDAQTLIKVQVWEGEVYTNTAYADQPWEQEAYELEESVKLEALNLL